MSENQEEDQIVYENTFPGSPQFNEIIHCAERAILAGILPERIYRGSSGSYFVKDEDNRVIGVFKPKDEEPYGRLNPKWTKYMQRMCCPCCFGRSCLAIGQGYLSEAGASLVDDKLGLGVVPTTRVVHLAAKSFNYMPHDRAASSMKKNIFEQIPKLGRHFQRLGLPTKVGSFQLFVRGFQDADVWLRCTSQDLDSDPLNKENVMESFIDQFQRICILDYVIRNTDRTNENWLIKYENDAEKIKLCAIDNGLAFPYKHPNEWRAYPYYWSWLSYAKEPFTRQIRETFFPLLSDMNFVQELCHELGSLFMNNKQFERQIFERQMSVLRGQILNLSQALSQGKSPYELVQMPPISVERNTILGTGSEDTIGSSDGTFYRQRVSVDRPYFVRW